MYDKDERIREIDSELIRLNIKFRLKSTNKSNDLLIKKCVVRDVCRFITYLV